MASDTHDPALVEAVAQAWTGTGVRPPVRSVLAFLDAITAAGKKIVNADAESAEASRINVLAEVCYETTVCGMDDAEEAAQEPDWDDLNPYIQGEWIATAIDLRGRLRQAGYHIVKDGTIGTVAQDAHEDGAAARQAEIEAILREELATAPYGNAVQNAIRRTLLWALRAIGDGE